jgi:hypothetical protein
MNNASRTRLSDGRLHTMTFAALFLGLWVDVAWSQDLSRYRAFQLGASVASVVTLSATPGSEARTIHQRPALLQSLEWRPSYFMSGSTAPRTDPVRQIGFSFYNDQLYRLVVEYDSQRTEGMTDADMVDAITAVYGAGSKPTIKSSRIAATQTALDAGTVVGQWGDVENSVVLSRALYGTGFRLVITSRRVAALANTAEAQALALDEREAPQREMEREKKDAENSRLLQEKARLTNKAAFKP